MNAIYRYPNGVASCLRMFDPPRESRGPLLCLKIEKLPDYMLDREADADDAEDHEEKRFFRCATCQHPITRPDDRIRVDERHQHVFANPHGYIFTIGCFAAAQGCIIAGEETHFFSWFSGYSWRYAHCAQCLTHLGWAFRAKDSQFIGLILDKLRC